jgi:hypothetical protein
MSAIGELRPLEPLSQLVERLDATAGMVGVMNAFDVEIGFGLLKQMLPTKAKRSRRDGPD